MHSSIFFQKETAEALRFLASKGHNVIQKAREVFVSKVEVFLGASPSASVSVLEGAKPSNQSPAPNFSLLGAGMEDEGTHLPDGRGVPRGEA